MLSTSSFEFFLYKLVCEFLAAIWLQGNFALVALVYFVVMPVRAVVRSSSWCFFWYQRRKDWNQMQHHAARWAFAVCLAFRWFTWHSPCLLHKQMEVVLLGVIQQGVSKDVGATAQLHQEKHGFAGLFGFAWWDCPWKCIWRTGQAEPIPPIFDWMMEGHQWDCGECICCAAI